MCKHQSRRWRLRRMMINCPNNFIFKAWHWIMRSCEWKVAATSKSFADNLSSLKCSRWHTAHNRWRGDVSKGWWLRDQKSESGRHGMSSGVIDTQSLLLCTCRGFGNTPQAFYRIKFSQIHFPQSFPPFSLRLFISIAFLVQTTSGS